MLLKLIIDRIKRNWFEFRLRKAGPFGRADILRPYFYHIGKECELYPMTYGTEPYLINIGDKVCVASAVRFVTHDVSCYRMAEYLGISGNCVQKVGGITLKDNCFVGAYSTLMPGCSVGKNSVIAACSVVTKHVPDGEVWGRLSENPSLSQ